MLVNIPRSTPWVGLYSALLVITGSSKAWLVKMVNSLDGA